METMEIRIHSVTDLITNSSTTIYTNSLGSIGACKEMIDEFFKVLGVDKKCDDVFNLVVTMEDTYIYEDLNNDFSDELLNDVRTGKVEKPKWMIDAERSADINTYLHVTAKSPEYEKLAKLVKTFLYSDRAFEGSC